MLEQYSHRSKLRFNQISCPVAEFCPCGIDIGYSAIKTKSSHSEAIVPSIVVKANEDVALLTNSNDIRYKDENGVLWFVGTLAKKSLSSEAALSKTNNLLSRQRVLSTEFLVQIRVAMFLCMLKGFADGECICDERPLKIQTGLPPQYLKRDSALLKSRFVGTHIFSVKLGKNEWKDVILDINDDDVAICRQPFGTLMSCVMNTDGKMVDVALLSRNLLVVDPGFHSVDTLYCMQGAAKEGDSITWENHGMQEIFQRTCNDIAKNTDNQADIDVYQLEKTLARGSLYYGQRKQEYNYVQDFERNLRQVCLEFLKRLDSTYDNMLDVDVIIVTGGTGCAWKDIINDYYKDMKGLTIIMANGVKDVVLANVQGYYNYLISKLVQKRKM